MRLILAAAAATTMLASGFASGVGQAADTLAPVGSVHVTPAIDKQGATFVDVSWSNVDSKADGVVVCAKRGTTITSRPRHCETRLTFSPTQFSSGLIALQQQKTYTFSVYSYQGTTPITYGQPTSVTRHGTKVTFQSHCASQNPGDTCRIDGVLTDTFRQATLSRRPIELWVSRGTNGARWDLADRFLTHRDGSAHATVTLDHSRLYQWRYAAAGKHQLNTSTARYQIVVNRYPRAATPAASRAGPLSRACS